MFALLNVPAPIRFILGLAALIAGVVIHQYVLALIGGAVLVMAAFRLAGSYRKGGGSGRSRSYQR
jgi:hypothetical protein